jgi:hypothetical protein
MRPEELRRRCAELKLTNACNAEQRRRRHHGETGGGTSHAVMREAEPGSGVIRIRQLIVQTRGAQEVQAW